VVTSMIHTPQIINYRKVIKMNRPMLLTFVVNCAEVLYA
jgi:hypothetical protein